MSILQHSSYIYREQRGLSLAEGFKVFHKVANYGSNSHWERCSHLVSNGASSYSEMLCLINFDSVVSFVIVFVLLLSLCCLLWPLEVCWIDWIVWR